ncbi:Imm1 family immunity protein [Streptomyces sp. NPDC096176]|uniref:Imm1 family immunity protein n=1 Tax=Streptomyces sp. NPDC096176 TaxID=3366079 RepID=UPI0037F3C39F
MTKVQVQAYYKKQHAEEPALISSPEDVDALIDSLAFGAEFESMAVLQSLQREDLPSGFPDHEFLVGANGERQVGIVSFVDDKNYISTSASKVQGEVVYHVAENPTEFPAAAEIPLPLVREAVKEFLLSGGRRPTCIEWQEEPGI